MESSITGDKPRLDLPEIVIQTEEVTEKIIIEQQPEIKESIKKPNLISEEEFLGMWKPMPFSRGKQKKLKR